MRKGIQRILHVDGDSFFASCEMALDPSLRKRPVFVGGGRRGDGIVIAANYLAKRYGITTGMACFEARRRCPEGVLTKPHYTEYRRFSLELFRILKQYTPLLVPTSIDEGFLDFTDSPRVFHCPDPPSLIRRVKRELAAEVGVPISAGLGSSRWLAKLITEQSKPDGFAEVTEHREASYLREIPVKELTGIADRRARSLQALGVWTFGDVACLPLEVLRKRYGDFGMQLWLFARGEYRERLALENKPRTCISSCTTLPRNEPDYDAALLFLLDQAERLIANLVRENLKARELGVSVQFHNLEGHGCGVRFPSAQAAPNVLLTQIEQLFGRAVGKETRPIRQVAVHFANLAPLHLDAELFGRPTDLRRWELQQALDQIESQFGPGRVKTGNRLLLERQAGHLVGDKAKCPFLVQREMELTVGRIVLPSLDPVYEDDWQPAEAAVTESPDLPRTWGRSTTRELKFA